MVAKSASLAPRNETMELKPQCLGIIRNQGFFGAAKWISSTHRMGGLDWWFGDDQITQQGSKKKQSSFPHGLEPGANVKSCTGLFWIGGLEGARIAFMTHLPLSQSLRLLVHLSSGVPLTFSEPTPCPWWFCRWLP